MDKYNWPILELNWLEALPQSVMNLWLQYKTHNQTSNPLRTDPGGGLRGPGPPWAQKKKLVSKFSQKKKKQEEDLGLPLSF